MKERNRDFCRHNPRRVLWMVASVVVLSLVSLLQQAWAQSNVTRRQQSKPKTEKKETYTRPKPTHKIAPEMPSQDRYVTNKVFLERADSLYHNEMNPGCQIVSGGVMFRQGNMRMYCDSAYYYGELNSLNAFGHVKMASGDTLFVYADRMYYDGMQKLARLRNGPTQPQVKVQNRRVTLTSDSLFYSVAMDRGWYDCGGRLEDDVNVLTSRYGEYSPSLKTADFYGNVVLRGKKNGNQLLTDTLYYNTSTHEAQIVSRTDIYSSTDTIETSRGTYNTQTGNARLESRSTITHTDSNNNATKLTGDIIVYDKATRTSRAYMFDDPARVPRPMVLNDTAHKVRLISNYGEYNEVTRSAFATGNPMMVEYSRPDTNYLRADSIYTWIVQQRTVAPYTPRQQQLLDSLMAEQRTLDARADSIEAVCRRQIEHGDTSVVIPPRRNLVAERPELQRDSILKDFCVAKAIKHSRFFNQQIQAIADTMHLVQFDSLLYLKRKPIVWSDNRQVCGDSITVHFNDSTADYARVVNGFVAENVAEDFYNQLKGKAMFATFRDNQLRHLSVDDNVEVVLLPAEKDSTYNKIIKAESEHLTVDMADRELEKLKMWSAVDGTVTPIFKVKQGDKYLQGFQWQEALRPRREWYDGRWIWDDDLGDVSDEMIDYFKKEESQSGTLEEYFGQ